MTVSPDHSHHHHHRHYLQSGFFVTLAAVLGCAPLPSAADPCSVAGPSARISHARKNQAPLRVSGRVYRPDGKTPAAGVVMYVYHTGADGLYGKDSAGGPVYRGWLRTGKDGQYQYDTIRPGPYPSGEMPAHIHIQFWGPDVGLQYADDLHFADDPKVSPAERDASAKAGQFAYVVQIERHHGILTATQNFRLKPRPDRFEESIMHGFKRCGAAANH